MNKTSKNIVAGIIGIATIGTAGAASAHLGNAENRAAIKEALETSSYSAFQEAASDSRIIENIDSQEKFNQLVEAQELRESGDTEGAKAIKQELGLGGDRGKDKNPAVREAIEANDYAAFQETATDGKIAEVIDTEEKFSTLVEAHNLKESGDNEGAKALKEELGLGGKDKGQHDRGQRRGEG